MLTADKNLLVSQDIAEKDVAFYNVKNKPFDLYGMHTKESRSQTKQQYRSTAHPRKESSADLFRGHMSHRTPSP